MFSLGNNFIISVAVGRFRGAPELLLTRRSRGKGTARRECFLGCGAAAAIWLVIGGRAVSADLGGRPPSSPGEKRGKKRKGEVEEYDRKKKFFFSSFFDT